MVILAGRRITPIYAGASQGFPGLWQINFVLPPDIELGCFQPVQVSAGGEVGNLATIAIAAAGEAVCTDPNLGPDSLTKLDAGGSIVGGVFAISRSSSSPPPVMQEAASGWFSRWTAAQWAAGTQTRPNIGQCGVYDRTYPTNGTDPFDPERFLDAGANLPLSGPGLSAGAGLGRTVTPRGGVYLLTPAADTFRTGLYTLRGNGGAEIGPFNVSVNFPASFTVTNWDSITVVDRSQALEVQWTGDGLGFVTIALGSSRVDGANQRLVGIACWVQASAGVFSVPASALSALQSEPATSFLSVTGYNFTSFTTNLVQGGQIDFGSFAGSISVSKSIPVR